MDERKAPATNKEFLEALTELFEQMEPDTPDEVDAFLRETGYEPEQIAAKIKAATERGLSESPLNWRNKTQELEADKKRLSNFADIAKRSRHELMDAINAALSNLAVKNPELAAVHHRNFESATDEDLESLLADLYFLDAAQVHPPGQSTPKE